MFNLSGRYLDDDCVLQCVGTENEIREIIELELPYLDYKWALITLMR